MAMAVPIESTERVMLIVPNGDRPLQESFINFLWDKEFGAFLAHNEYVRAWEGMPSYGIRISPGSC
jgi:hypothetical protein